MGMRVYVWVIERLEKKEKMEWLWWKATGLCESSRERARNTKRSYQEIDPTSKFRLRKYVRIFS